MNSGALAVFDLDGTLTRHDTMLPFVCGWLARHPWRLPRLALLLPAALRFVFDRDRGTLKGSVLRAALGGASRAAVRRWREQFVPRVLRRGLFAEALRAIADHRSRGDRLLLMSASTDLYVPALARALGFDECICTEVRWRPDGRLDGRLASANCRGEEKRRCLAALIARDAPGSISAYGNSDSDLPHLQLAQHAYLVNGPARLPAGAEQRLQRLHWQTQGAP